MCTLFMSRLDIKERKEDLKINYKNFFLILMERGHINISSIMPKYFGQLKGKKIAVKRCS